MTVMQFSELLDTVAEFFEDPAVPCANADSDWCAKSEAQWRVHIQCPDCRAHDWALWCTPCRDLVIVTEDGFECARCEALVFPGRRMVKEFLPMERLR